MHRRRYSLARIPIALGLTLGGLSIAACALPWRGFTFVTWWREGHSGVVRWKADTEARLVALTFDDGPDPRQTPRILEFLRRYQARATFFLVGKQMEACPALTREIVVQGHAVGNHTYDHPYLDRLSPEAVRQEIARCDASIGTILHRRTSLFRPPRGDWNPTIFEAAQRQGDTLILWTVALEHHETPTPRAMADRALRLIRPGSILLLHDGGNRETTVQALPLLLEGLHARGYRCVTVPELLHLPGDAMR